MREKLIDIVECYADFLDWDTKEDMVDSIMEKCFATDNNVGDKWISVKDRLPNPSTYVLVLTAPGYLSVGQNCVVADYIHPSGEEHGVFVMAYRYWEDPLKVTHWMPLPKPPKGE